MSISKTYSNKSNAKRAATKAAAKEFNLNEKVIKANLDTYIEFKGNKHAGFTYELLTVVEPEEVKEPVVIKALELHSVSIVKEPVNPDCVIKKVTEVTTIERVSKIQKERETRNGITRPSEGGKCAAAWAIMDDLTAKRGSPTPFKPVAEEAERQGLNPAMARSNYAVWRKFNGVVGRIVDKKES